MGTVVVTTCDVRAANNEKAAVGLTLCTEHNGCASLVNRGCDEWRYYLAAHRRLVNVLTLTSNSAFFIFAFLVV